MALHLTWRHNGTGGGVTAILQALAQQGIEPVPSRRTIYRLVRRHHTEVKERRSCASISYDLSAQVLPYGIRCQRVPCAAPHPSLNPHGRTSDVYPVLA